MPVFLAGGGFDLGLYRLAFPASRHTFILRPKCRASKVRDNVFTPLLKGKDMRAAFVCWITLSLTPGVFAAPLNGVWELTIMRFGYPSYRRATLESRGDQLTGKSGDLTIEGTAHGDNVALMARSKD